MDTSLTRITYTVPNDVAVGVAFEARFGGNDRIVERALPRGLLGVPIPASIAALNPYSGRLKSPSLHRTFGPVEQTGG